MRKILIQIVLSLVSVNCMLSSEEAKRPEMKNGTNKINVLRLKNNNGSVRIALYNSSDTFCMRGKEFRSRVIKPSEKKAIAQFTELPRDEYAIALFHDENNDDKFNKGLLFIIFRERYGFSNDAKPLFSPPDFEDAKFILDSDPKIITITAQ